MGVFSYEKDGRKLFGIRYKKRSKRASAIHVQREKLGYLSEKEAQKAFEKMRDQVIREVALRELSGPLWGAITDAWQEVLRVDTGFGRPLTKRAKENQVQLVRTYTAEWNQRPVESLTSIDFQEVLKSMEEKGLSHSRMRSLKGAVNNVIRWAKEARRISPNFVSPAQGFKISFEDTKPPEILTLAEIRKLIKVAGDQEHPWYYVWLAALLTGMRSMELFSLLWSAVDLERRLLTVARSYSKRDGFKETKAAYWRYVPVNDELERVLKELRAKTRGGPDDFVFPRLPGWERSEAAKVLRTYCELIEIPSVRFHALRACFATQMLRNNVPAVTVMKIGGWKDLKTLMKYIRLAGIEVDNATQALSFAPAEVSTSQVVNIFQGARQLPKPE